MHRLEIEHHTHYRFARPVTLNPHTLRLRPREGHELRIESSTLSITPEPTLRWMRDVEGNSVANASFRGTTDCLAIVSRIVIQQYDQAPHDFLVDEGAVFFPFSYAEEDAILLAPYRVCDAESASRVADWTHGIWQANDTIQTFSLLLKINQRIYQTLRYQQREAEGVQRPDETLVSGSGSCRDFANLFMAIARQLGFAARFVSGYSYVGDTSEQPGSTHAWAEVFIPGAGWKGFDPTYGTLAGPNHIAVAVARSPQTVPPVAGTFHGPPGSQMQVNVRVRRLT